MKRSLAILTFALAAVAMLLGQRLLPGPTAALPMEVLSVFPHEFQPGQYQQVEQRQLDNYAQQGWELVAVTPFIYRNEERNIGEMKGPKPVVTQTYPAYFFKRVKAVR